MGDPLVSIINPVLNRVETMGACLASIARQTYRPIEHIVVDGGSTDGTLDLPREYRAPYPFRCASDPDNGMYEAINRGIAISRGEVLAYLNSDDLFFPLSVDAAVRAIDDDGRGFTHGPEMERVKTSVTWRVRQLELLRAVKARYPRKWQHFVQQLHAHGVDVRLRDLRVLAPARWRGDASLFGHARSLHDLLDVRA
jgi:glycosyltransferase involved in cell wall biosynthesis